MTPHQLLVGIDVTTLGSLHEHRLIQAAGPPLLPYTSAAILVPG
jgi:hypothetical protein